MVSIAATQCNGADIRKKKKDHLFNIRIKRKRELAV